MAQAKNDLGKNRAHKIHRKYQLDIFIYLLLRGDGGGCTPQQPIYLAFQRRRGAPPQPLNRG